MANPWAEPLPAPLAELPIFLALLPDLPDSKRLSVRPVHLELSGKGYEVGWILNGGPTFSKADPKFMDGSWMLLRSRSLEEAEERLKRDIYATGGAWDLQKMAITQVGAAKK